MFDLCVKLGAKPNDLVPFEKYAAAAQSLTRPASAARALNNGAPYIERADKLVQLIAKQKGLSHPVIDAQVALVDARLEANRKKAAALVRLIPKCERRTDRSPERRAVRSGVLNRLSDTVFSSRHQAGPTAFRRLQKRRQPAGFRTENVTFHATLRFLSVEIGLNCLKRQQLLTFSPCRSRVGRV